MRIPRPGSQGSALLGCALMIFAHAAVGQNGDRFQDRQSSAARPARLLGSVTGTVFFGDTQRPGRFVFVDLTRVTAGGFSTGGPNTHTSLDGTFQIENVEVGDYYVSASATGYISPFSEAQAALAEGVPQDQALRRLAVVHVSQGTSASVTVTLERGAVIAGNVTWDDGSPAAGVQVSTVSATTQASGPGRAFGSSGGGPGFGRFAGTIVGTTDDRGRFRLMGVPPGEYYVRASVQAPTIGGGRGGDFRRSVSLTAYAPGKLRRADAQTFKLTGAEERDDVAIILDLHALHTVSGRVSSAGGGAVTGGQVRLVDSTDGSLSRFAEIGSDGSFSVLYVPAGTYNMTLNARAGGSGTAGPGNNNPNPGFQQIEQTLAVTDGDVSGLTFTVTPATTASR